MMSRMLFMVLFLFFAGAGQAVELRDPGSYFFTETFGDMTEEMMPKISVTARPLKIGSRVITILPSNVVPAVSNIGRIRTAPAWIKASCSVMPLRND